MKKVNILFKLQLIIISTTLFLTSCEFMDSDVEVKDMDIDYKTYTTTSYRYSNYRVIEILHKTNVHALRFTSKNYGELTAYDVNADIDIFTARGAFISDKIYIGKIEGFESVNTVYNITLEDDVVEEFEIKLYWD